jgi:hypothetical protein
MKSLCGTLLVLLLLCPAVSRADSISCDKGIVSTGDSAVDLLLKYGQPEWQDRRIEEITEGAGMGARRTTTVTVEDWTYNFGPQRFLRIVTFRNGVVTDVRTGGYGR